MFGYTRKIVTVTFMDHATGQIISSARMPLERLPEAFAADAELHMAGAHYVVMRAEPQTKAEFARTKQLKVAVRKRVAPAP
jgi:hypothetical protein